MKKSHLFFLLALAVNFTIMAQTPDTSDIDYKMKVLEFQKKELELQRMKSSDTNDIDYKFKMIEYEKRMMDLQQLRENKKKAESKELSPWEIERMEEIKKHTRMMQSPIKLHMNLLSLLVGGFEMGVESKLTEVSGIRLMVGYFYGEKVAYYENQENNKYSGMKVDLQYRFYEYQPKKDPKRQIYYGVFGLYRQITIENVTNYYQNGIVFSGTGNTTISVNAFTPGFMIGTQMHAFSKAYLDAFVGVGYNFPNSNENARTVTLPVVNHYRFGPTVRMNITLNFSLK